LEPEKAHPTGEFIVVAKFGGHVLRHLASRREGREGGTPKIIFSIF